MRSRFWGLGVRMGGGKGGGRGRRKGESVLQGFSPLEMAVEVEKVVAALAPGSGVDAAVFARPRRLLLAQRLRERFGNVIFLIGVLRREGLWWRGWWWFRGGARGVMGF